MSTPTPRSRLPWALLLLMAASLAAAALTVAWAPDPAGEAEGAAGGGAALQSPLGG